ncbi:alpha/beta hydrolase family protein [Actinopolymorpha pittospori]|uniref:Dipeptidyl aminopeptidase/acylaminoacyl peptidase n=1 Tax=Actinopolymorpha pittospori TaxID=648752 RepID=A0A927RKD6_9ACTN|nr:prolyl oligopeptidase family serine peptidase [Actinopolymorpha pittospori]MBE1608146.1 dipeptidyl aminopeptidase/acylaminoacyl peptidase [Actinopolymorpha pittospori]
MTVRARRTVTAEQVVLRYDLDTGEAAILREEHAKLQPVGATAGHGLIAAFEDFHHPADLYAFDTECQQSRRLTTVEPRLEGIRIGVVDSFETVVPRHDGTLQPTTTAVLMPAGNSRGDRLPAVMFLYPGGRVSGAAADFTGGAPATLPLAALLTRGYAVLLAETPIGPEGQAENPLQELVDVTVPQVYHAAELGYVDLGRIALAGHSYGGYGTAAIISGTNIFRAAVAISGLYDLAGGYGWNDFATMPSRFWYFETGQARMGTHPWASLERYLANSPYYQADRIHTPLLLIHGAEDSFCPVEDAGKLLNALKRLNRTATLAVYKGEGHVPTEWSRSNAIDALKRTIEFLDTHLKQPKVDAER